MSVLPDVVGRPFLFYFIYLVLLLGMSFLFLLDLDIWHLAKTAIQLFKKLNGAGG